MNAAAYKDVAAAFMSRLPLNSGRVFCGVGSLFAGGCGRLPRAPGRQRDILVDIGAQALIRAELNDHGNAAERRKGRQALRSVPAASKPKGSGRPPPGSNCERQS